MRGSTRYGVIPSVASLPAAGRESLVVLGVTENLKLQSSVQHTAERIKRLASERITRFNGNRFLEAAHRLRVHLFSEVRAAMIVVRKMAWFVTLGIDSLLQPGTRLNELAL